jgi:hypothetical protein
LISWFQEKLPISNYINTYTSVKFIYESRGYTLKAVGKWGGVGKAVRESNERG